MKQWDSKLLEKLLVIQDIDLQIRGVADTVKELQQRCMREDPQLNTLKAEYQSISESLESTRAQKEMYQNTLEDIRSAIKGLIANRARAFKPRNRSSTEALRTEEEKLSILVVETDEQIEILEKNLKSIQTRIEERAHEVQRSQQAPEAKIKIHNNHINDLERKRNAELQGVPIALVKKYERLRASRSGVGLTILEDGICRVCRMEMPTGIKSKLLQDEVIDACPACGRMVARIENTIDHKRLAEEARAAQERKMREEEEAAARAEAKAKREAEAEKKAAAKAKREADKQAKAERVAALAARKALIEKRQKEKQKAESSAEPVADARSKKAKSGKAAAAPKGDIAKKAPVQKAPAKKAPAPKAPVQPVTGKKATGKKTPAKKAPATKAAAPKAPAKKAPAKKAPAKKAPAKKAPAKKAPVQKAPAKKTPVKKAPVKKAPAKKTPSKKAPAEKAPAEKAPAKKTPAKKAPAKKAASKKTSKK
ncbi:MAG: hypothetical protein JXX14_07240 [Deltaproteobacteria bacterium]|nr:hypothetical protein [Deltaproteobacteria bacterium]